MQMKYILVTGGVISGVGKGIIASSLGVILKCHGFCVSAIKIDPYINIDAGTFSPYEHGEVFVLDDGGEVDLDLGNYERFLGVRLRRDNNITTGKIYKHVIDRERRGDYLGKTVQVVPHITDAIQEWVQRVAGEPVDNTGLKPHVCIIELGGTIGDIEGMPFVEAFRQFQFRVKKENFMNVHVSLIPEPRSTGEQKTKPTQNSVRELRGLGLSPDLVICRSETSLVSSVINKVSNFCHVAPEQVLCVHDVSNIYHVPLLLSDQNVFKFLFERLELYSAADGSHRFLSLDSKISEPLARWEQLAQRCDRMQQSIAIALVGKYVQLEDAYTSVTKALNHAAIDVGRKLVVKFIDSEKLEEKTKTENPGSYHEAWKQLTTAKGILVPGGFGDRGIEGKISACSWAREHKIPFLGVCLGMQCAVIEFARKVLGWKEANSTEFNSALPPNCQVIVDMPEHNPATDQQGMGATMRLGRRTTVFLTKNSKLRRLYNNAPAVEERHRHRYEVNPNMIERFSEKGMCFVGMGADEGSDEDILCTDEMQRTASSAALVKLALNGDCRALADNIAAKLQHLRLKETDSVTPPTIRMEIVELKDHPYFVGVQYHPEYLSHPLRPSPPYLGLLLAASGQLEDYLTGTLAALRNTDGIITRFSPTTESFFLGAGPRKIPTTTKPLPVNKFQVSNGNGYYSGYQQNGECTTILSTSL